jgi:hypothetical protein
MRNSQLRSKRPPHILRMRPPHLEEESDVTTTEIFEQPVDSAMQTPKRRGFGFYLLWSVVVIVSGLVAMVTLAVAMGPDTVTKQVAVPGRRSPFRCPARQRL